MRGDSICDSALCEPKDSLLLQISLDTPVQALLHRAALSLSAAGRHAAAVILLDEGLSRFGEVDSLRLLEAEEFFLAGRFESALGLNYAMEKRLPGSRQMFLVQRERFFHTLGMEKDARQISVKMPTPPVSVLPSWSGWYAFDVSDSRIHYDPIHSRVQQLASEITRGTPASAASAGLDTVRVYGRTKEHSAGMSWNWSGGGTSLRLDPWARATLDAASDTLEQWAAGARIVLARNLSESRVSLSASLSRIAYFSDGMRNDAGLSAAWDHYTKQGSWKLSLSGSQVASVSQVGETPVHYRQGSLAISGRRRFDHGISLSGSFGLSSYFGPESRSMDSVAKVVDVSGMRDTVLLLRNLSTLPSWLTLYDSSGNSWEPGFSGIRSAPYTTQSVPFAEVTPSSNGGPSLNVSLSWAPHPRISFFASGGVSWRIWFQKTRWSIAMLGKNYSTDELTLWHDRETGAWYLVEPHTAISNDIDRRVLPFETFVRRREDLDLSETLGASLDLGIFGDVTGSWSAETNWSNIDDKDSDSNVWDSRAFSLQWNVSF